MKRPHAAIDEREVGICEYVSPDTVAIGGTVKTRPEDFVVTEIDRAGSAVQLAGGDNDDDGNAANELSDELPFTRFVLRKERMDTLGAIALLSYEFGVPARAFSFAGLKDHRAITTQEMTVRGIAPAALLTANTHGDRLAIGRVRRVEAPLKLGMLSGNRFRILLRGVCGSENEVEAALGALRRRGFINYYGLQRFGDCAARNDEVGRHLLLRDYAAAVDALLQPHSNEGDGGAGTNSGAEREAREAWLRSGDARTVLRLMPKTRILEREVLSSLAHTLPRSGSLSHEERCRLAMLGLPLTMRRLLAHAYFSKAFNRAASERLRRHGLSAARQGEAVITRKRPFYGGKGPAARRAAVHFVTAEEAAAGTYSARRIVLPLPGAAIPAGAFDGFYAQMLDFDGIDPHAPALECGAHEDPTKSAWLELQGDYRSLILRPRRMTWEVVRTPVAESSAHDPGMAEAAPPELEPAPGTATLPPLDVLAEFDLPAGAYATQALREVQKLHRPASRQSHIRFA